MTSAIETRRFKAKCKSKETYIVIEKTKETKEPRGRGGQTVITSQKTYFLDTEEKVNKLNSTDFLIIKRNLIIRKTEPFISKSFIADIKTLFDGLKNLALCLAILLALPTMQAMAASAYDHRWFTVGFVWAGLAMVILLALYNFLWLYSTMEANPKSNFLNSFSWLATALITAITFFCATVITLPKLILSPTGSDTLIDLLGALPK
ncbi:hypothetical protein [Pseudomonas putida]|uniref:hypothetical protein n=1 Tax=Pseudomonas putida TaxID=303 RepID=UPI00126017A0|nr:hypothetical protein [Pseudomonas putida]